MLSIGRQERVLKKLSPIFFQVEEPSEKHCVPILIIRSRRWRSPLSPQLPEGGFQENQRNRCGGSRIFSPDVAGRIQAESEFQRL
jgi:hypothetical protein